MGTKLKLIVNGQEIVCDNDLTMTIERQPIGEVQINDVSQIPENEFFDITVDGIDYEGKLVDGKILLY